MPVGCCSAWVHLLWWAAPWPVDGGWDSTAVELKPNAQQQRCSAADEPKRLHDTIDEVAQTRLMASEEAGHKNHHKNLHELGWLEAHGPELNPTRGTARPIRDPGG